MWDLRGSGQEPAGSTLKMEKTTVCVVPSLTGEHTGGAESFQWLTSDKFIRKEIPGAASHSKTPACFVDALAGAAHPTSTFLWVPTTHPGTSCWVWFPPAAFSCTCSGEGEMKGAAGGYTLPKRHEKAPPEQSPSAAAKAKWKETETCDRFLHHGYNQSVCFSSHFLLVFHYEEDTW